MPAVPVASLIAEGGAIDSLSGRLTIFNALDTVFAPAFPAAMGRLWFVIVYEVGPSPDSFVERVVLSGPDGKEVRVSFADINADGPAVMSTHTSIHNLAGTTFPLPGSYSFVVDRAPTRNGEWTRVAARRLNVMATPAVQRQVTEASSPIVTQEPVQH